MANEHGNNQASKAMNQILVLGALVFFFTVLIFLFMLCIYAIMRRRVYLELPLARRNPGWLRRLSSIRENQSRVRNTGLDAKIIELLPMFVYTGSSTPGGTECSVCLSEFEDGEKLRLLPGCKHSFHTDCIDMWFHSHANCPLCRTKVEATVNNVLPEESGASSSNARDNLSIDMNIAVEQGQTSPSLPSMGIDSLSAEPDSFSSDMEMEETNSPSGSQSSRFSRLHSLKRMLSGRSRDGKVFPSNLHQNQNEIEGHS